VGKKQKDPLRAFTLQEEHALRRITNATSERLDVVKRARALLCVQEGRSFTDAAREAGYQSGDSVSQLVQHFNQRGLLVLLIAPGRGRKPTSTSLERARIVQEVQREPERAVDQTATWSLCLLRKALHKAWLPRLSKETIRVMLHEAGYQFGKTRTWCPTGTAVRKRKAGAVIVHDPNAQEKQALIDLAYVQAETTGLPLWCQDEAGPYQAVPHPGEIWHPDGKPVTQPHEYVRGGTAKLLTLFRPATGQVQAKGVLSAPNAILHPWLQEELQAILDQLDKEPHSRSVSLPEDHPLMLVWQQWWRSDEDPPPAPPLRLILIWDNLAGHRSNEMLQWLLQRGILPLYTPLSGSWLNMAESLQRIVVRRALSGHHPQTAQQVIDWLEQIVVGWNQQPTPFVWNGVRRRRRERARLRCLGGSGAGVVNGYPIAS
jgi:transposase